MPDRGLAYPPRIRGYHETLGFEVPYAWAQFDDVPIANLAKPLPSTTIGIVTAAGPFNPARAIGPRRFM